MAKQSYEITASHVQQMAGAVLYQAQPPLGETDQIANNDSGSMVTPLHVPASAELRQFLGLRFWDRDLVHAARYLVERAAAGMRLQVFFVNAHCVNVAARNPAYSKLLKSAPFLFADGFGMALAARLWGRPLANNVNGTDLFPEICKAAAAASVPIALLGAAPGVARTCAIQIQKEYPGLRVVWDEHGYHSSAEEAARLADLNASGARILFVAKGVPLQELWIASHAGQLEPPVVLAVGALFDFYSGKVKRAPRLIRRLRAEWAYRLYYEPCRLFGRYMFGNPAFLARALLWRLAGR